MVSNFIHLWPIKELFILEIFVLTYLSKCYQTLFFVMLSICRINVRVVTTYPYHAADFFKKDDKYYSKLEICVVCRGFLAFKYVYIVFFKTNQMIGNLKISRLKPVFCYIISICICVETLFCNLTPSKCSLFLNFVQKKQFWCMNKHYTLVL